jgi:hypothetical protein
MIPRRVVAIRPRQVALRDPARALRTAATWCPTRESATIHRGRAAAAGFRNQSQPSDGARSPSAARVLLPTSPSSTSPWGLKLPPAAQSGTIDSAPIGRPSLSQHGCAPVNDFLLAELDRQIASATARVERLGLLIDRQRTLGISPLKAEALVVEVEGFLISLRAHRRAITGE